MATSRRVGPQLFSTETAEGTKPHGKPHSAEIDAVKANFLTGGRGWDSFNSFEIPLNFSSLPRPASRGYLLGGHAWSPAAFAKNCSKSSRRQTVQREERRIPRGSLPSACHFQNVEVPMPKKIAPSLARMTPFVFSCSIVCLHSFLWTMGLLKLNNPSCCLVG